MPETLDASGAARRISGRREVKGWMVGGWLGGEGTTRRRVGVEIRVEAGRSATSRAPGAEINAPAIIFIRRRRCRRHSRSCLDR